MFGVLAIVAVCGVFYLTFQGPEETTELSRKAVEWLTKIGIETQSKQLRHIIHYAEYAILGLLFYLWLQSWKAFPMTVSTALLEEGIKILLPTREFDPTDLLRDIVGAAVVISIARLVDQWISRNSM